jgi:hypothetical protein
MVRIGEAWRSAAMRHGGGSRNAHGSTASRQGKRSRAECLHEMNDMNTGFTGTKRMARSGAALGCVTVANSQKEHNTR